MEKSDRKSRYRLFTKITDLLADMNETLAYPGLKIVTNTEYTPDSPDAILSEYAFFCHVDETKFVSGRGHRKSREQRYYEKLKKYTGKLREYVVRSESAGRSVTVIPKQTMTPHL